MGKISQLYGSIYMQGKSLPLPPHPFVYRIVTDYDKTEALTALLDKEPKVPYTVLRETPAFAYGITRLVRLTDDGQCVMLYCENFTELSNSPIRTPEQEADYVRALYLKHCADAEASEFVNL